MIRFLTSATKKFSPYLHFTRDEWAALRNSTPLTLSEAELGKLQGINEHVSMIEVTQIYLPLARLLNLYVDEVKNLYEATHVFLNTSARKVPFIIGIAGSVAVGKSTTARIVQALLERSSDNLRVDLVTTDGFLYPNRILLERGIMERKGFPESYHINALIQFLSDVKSGKPKVTAPVYSHLVYDIVPDQKIEVCQPDVLIIEGLNVLQSPSHSASKRHPQVFVSDFFDFSIYVDAKEDHVRHWYEERFQTLRVTAFRQPEAYFYRYSALTKEEAHQVALDIWDRINGENLHENIAPTRNRADLILRKGRDHSVQSVSLRKL